MRALPQTGIGGFSAGAGTTITASVDPADDLDQGLTSVAFNQDIQRQFATIRTRLTDEPMLERIASARGGRPFARSGPREAGDRVGSGLPS